MSLPHPKRILFPAVLAALAFIGVSFTPLPVGVTPASAQEVSVEFRAVLQPHGQWRRSSRWGEVWIPANVERNWRPYTVGHWVYTDDLGWYWVTDEPEAKWGWVVYHYGRWVLDSELGWVWVPGREWAPAWVSWRRGRDHIGWAPLPPEQVVVEYRDEPDVWIFVRARDFTAPDVARVVIARSQVDTYVRQTVVVNRTVVVRDRGPQVVVVNPGIEPQIVSAVVGQPLDTYRVRPRVLAGTSRVPNAVEVQASEVQQDQQASASASVERTDTKIEPAKEVPEPQQLASDSSGRLGENPPKAAQAATQQGEQPQEGEAAQTQTNKEQEQQGQAVQQQPAEVDQQQGQAAQQQSDQKKEEKQEGQAAKQESDQKDEKQESQAAEQQPGQKQEAQDKQQGQAAQQRQQNQAADQKRKQEEQKEAGKAAQQQLKKDEGKAAQQEQKQRQDRSAQQEQEKQTKQDNQAAQQRRNKERQAEEARKDAAERAERAQDRQRPRPSESTGQGPARAGEAEQGREAPRARQSPKAAAPQRGGGGAAETPAAKPQRAPATDGRGASVERPDRGGDAAGAPARGPAAKPQGPAKTEGRGGAPAGGPGKKQD